MLHTTHISCHDLFVHRTRGTDMKIQPSEMRRHTRQPIWVVVATVLTLHPVNLPPVKVDFHLTVDSRPHAEGSSAENGGKQK